MSVGSEMRCPKCNKYLPDRCTCNGPSTEERRAAPIAAQLDQDAERAAFEAWCIRKGYSTNKWHDGGYVDSNTQNGWEVWRASAARRAEPVAAQLDAELPPLPTGSKASDVAAWCTIYPESQVRQAQRDAIAPYAERIRLLDHEAITQKLANQVLRDRVAFLESERNLMEANLRACIDGRTAGTAPKAPDPTEAAIERRAKEIYAGFVFADRYPWVDGGNSIRQDDARYQARAEFAAPSPQENTNG